MPRGILDAYKRFLEKMTVYYTVAGGVGEGYHKPASAPQGDPLSMKAMALLMRPRIMEMKTLSMKTRVLAVDLQLISVGPKRLGIFVAALDQTHAHPTQWGRRLPQTSRSLFRPITRQGMAKEAQAAETEQSGAGHWTRGIWGHT